MGRTQTKAEVKLLALYTMLRELEDAAKQKRISSRSQRATGQAQGTSHQRRLTLEEAKAAAIAKMKAAGGIKKQEDSVTAFNRRRRKKRQQHKDVVASANKLRATDESTVSTSTLVSNPAVGEKLVSGSPQTGGVHDGVSTAAVHRLSKQALYGQFHKGAQEGGTPATSTPQALAATAAKQTTAAPGGIHRRASTGTPVQPLVEQTQRSTVSLYVSGLADDGGDEDALRETFGEYGMCAQVPSMSRTHQTLWRALAAPYWPSVDLMARVLRLWTWTRAEPPTVPSLG
eukprot:m.371433 g.371433  ORF g.371433 m.371433 type:complete len:287 (-) comp20866_c0_seq1:458-1318(-)